MEEYMKMAEMTRNVREHLHMQHILLMLAVFMLIVHEAGIAYAATGSEEIVRAGTGLGGSFDEHLTNLQRARLEPCTPF